MQESVIVRIENDDDDCLPPYIEAIVWYEVVKNTYGADYDGHRWQHQEEVVIYKIEVEIPQGEEYEVVKNEIEDAIVTEFDKMIERGEVL